MNLNKNTNILNQHLLVFVDPDDDECKWWWPAIVITQELFTTFAEYVTATVDKPSEDEYLVCYFEDGSFSTVPKVDTLVFDPSANPFSDYSCGTHSEEFKQDPAVMSALLFYKYNTIPNTLSWLNKSIKKSSKNTAKKALYPHSPKESPSKKKTISSSSPNTLSKPIHVFKPLISSAPIILAKKSDKILTPANTPNIQINSVGGHIIKPHLGEDVKPIHPIQRKRLWSEKFVNETNDADASNGHGNE